MQTISEDAQTSQGESERPRRRPTLSAVRALMRKRYGPKAYLVENRHYSTPESRRVDSARRVELNAERKRIDAELAAMPKRWEQLTDLLKAVEFCCDVDAQEPSLSRLKAAREKAAQYVSLTETRPKDSDYPAYRKPRYAVGWTSGGGMFFHVQLEADTLEEMAEKLSAQEGGAA